MRRQTIVMAGGGAALFIMFAVVLILTTVLLLAKPKVPAAVEIPVRVTNEANQPVPVAVVMPEATPAPAPVATAAPAPTAAVPAQVQIDTAYVASQWTGARGVVRDARTGAGIPNVYVQLLDQSGRQVFATISDPSGRFSAMSPQYTPGVYRLVIAGDPALQPTSVTIILQPSATAVRDLMVTRA